MGHLELLMYVFDTAQPKFFDVPTQPHIVKDSSERRAGRLQCMSLRANKKSRITACDDIRFWNEKHVDRIFFSFCKDSRYLRNVKSCLLLMSAYVSGPHVNAATII